MRYSGQERLVEIGTRALLALVCLVFVLMLWNQHTRPHRYVSNDDLTGLDKFQVTRRLGKADHVIRSQQALAVEMGREITSVDPVEREVLVYPSHKVKLYIFIGKDYRVTHTETSFRAKR